jgi:hypothetical protein
LHNITFVVLLLLVLLAGAYFRFSGIDWGEASFMHPDERFLLMVGSALEPVESLGDYFNTATSTLNPHNRGHGFYVYGTLPMFLARYMVSWTFDQNGLMEMLEVGRLLSATFDLLTVLLVALIAFHLYGRAASLLAAAFAAFTVLHIQQSHYFTMDTFLTFFTALAIYFAVRVVTDSPQWPVRSGQLHPAAAEPQPPGEWEAAGPAEMDEPLPASREVSHAFAPAARPAGCFPPRSTC